METETANDTNISPDTQVALLLCSGLGASAGPKPLTPTEYNRVAVWLHQNNLRPADLLSVQSEARLPEGPDLPSPHQLRGLLERGRMLGLVLAKWADYGIWVLSRSDALYPERLRRLRGAAPPLLFGAGPLPLLNRGGLAIVGSRDIDEEGVTFTREAARRCAEQRVQIVSGGARGVDREALSSALEAGGTTIAVPVESLLKVVTERTARDAIRDQCLTVVTPYDPELGFTVGRAMGRNKYIYALADYALVVRFTTDEGGTWAGAVEQLGRNKAGSVDVPVYVRVPHNPEDGWRKLRGKGALPFPEEQFFQGDVTVVLSCAVAPSPDLSRPTPAVEAAITPSVPEDIKTISPKASSPPATAPSQEPAPPVLTSEPSAPTSEPATCYARCLPLLLQQLRDEPGEKQLAERLELQLGQAKQWLQRAIEEGKVKKREKKGRIVYTDAALAEKPTLFNRGDDAA